MRDPVQFHITPSAGILWQPSSRATSLRSDQANPRQGCRRPSVGLLWAARDLSHSPRLSFGVARPLSGRISIIPAVSDSLVPSPLSSAPRSHRSQYSRRCWRTRSESFRRASTTSSRPLPTSCKGSASPSPPCQHVLSMRLAVGLRHRSPQRPEQRTSRHPRLSQPPVKSYVESLPICFRHGTAGGSADQSTGHGAEAVRQVSPALPIALLSLWTRRKLPQRVGTIRLRSSLQCLMWAIDQRGLSADEVGFRLVVQGTIHAAFMR
jgi:hypothetical protein